MTEHTPTPWYFDALEFGRIHTADNLSVAEMFESDFSTSEDEANAAFIVRCVNSHDELVAALREAEACMSIVEPRSDKAEYLRILSVVRAALSRAEQP